jgi:hypothetical protein
MMWLDSTQREGTPREREREGRCIVIIAAQADGEIQGKASSSGKTDVLFKYLKGPKHEIFESGFFKQMLMVR